MTHPSALQHYVLARKNTCLSQLIHSPVAVKVSLFIMARFHLLIFQTWNKRRCYNWYKRTVKELVFRGAVRNALVKHMAYIDNETKKCITLCYIL